MAGKKMLYILRHGKAESGSGSQSDRDRGLLKRGMEAAQAIGEYLAGRRVEIDKVLCSTSVRTRQTLAQLQTAYKKLPTEFSDKLYLASASEMIRLITATPEEVQSLMLVGHNPGAHQMAVKLAKKGDDDTLNHLAVKFPTCALAAIALDKPWKEIVHAQGALEDFVTPKMLAIPED